MEHIIPYLSLDSSSGAPAALPECAALSQAEAASPWAQFFDASTPDVPEEILAVLRAKRPMSPAKAVLQNNVHSLLEPGYLEVETGYCQLPNGGAYATVLHKMPELTCEQFQWFMGWWPGKDIGYKLWCPGYHYKSAYGWVNEDVGNGPEDVYFIKDLMPEDFCFDPVVYSSSTTILTCSSNAISKRTGGGITEEPLPAVVAHFIRPAGTGMELRSKFWLGYQCTPGIGLHQVISPGRAVSWKQAYNFALHCAYEYSYLKRVAPKLYHAIHSQKANGGVLAK